jgi:hypothetical protein
VSGATVSFDLLTAHERQVHNALVVGERCGWPELEQLVQLLREVPGWTVHYSWHGVKPFRDHLGRTELGIPAGSFVAHVLEDSATGAFRVIAGSCAELRAALMTEPS